MITESIDRLRRSRADLVATVANWSQEQASFRPVPATWSAVEILEHLQRSEFTVVNILWKCWSGWRQGKPYWAGEHTNAGRTVEEIAAPFRGGKFDSPAQVQPQLGGPLQFWVDALCANDRLFEQLAPVLEKADIEKLVFPHFAVGPLDAGQWLWFLSLHQLKHREQIERLTLADNFPA